MVRPDGNGVLRVATWNIHGGRDRNGKPFDFENRISKISVDIVGLQELEVRRSPGCEVKDVDSLRSSGLEYSIAEVFSDSPFDQSAGLAVALLGSTSFTNPIAAALPNPVRTMKIDPTFHDKGIVISEITWMDSTIDIVSLHLFPFHRVGLNARDPRLRVVWDELDDLLKPRLNIPRIILGDFNTPYRSDLLRCIQLGELKSTFSDTPTRDSGDSHDDILASAQWCLTKRHNIRTESDHNLLVANFAIIPDEAEPSPDSIDEIGSGRTYV